MSRSIKTVCDSASSNSNGTLAVSPWIVLNTYMWDYNVGFRTLPAAAATGTYSIQETLSNFETFTQCPFTRSTTTLTITFTAHGLTTSDGVVLSGSSWDQPGYTFPVASVVDANTITVAVANSGPSSGTVLVAPIMINTDSNYSAVSGAQTGATIAGITGIRVVKGGGTLAGKVTLEVVQSGF
jgi:hypothetical protein